MNIGVDASRVAVAQRTGTERYCYELLGALAQIDRYHHYTLYCNGLPQALPPLGTNFTLRNIPAPRLWTHLRLGPEIIHYQPDVMFVPAHVLPLFHPQNSVVTIHDLGYLTFPEAHTPIRRLELHLTTLWSARAARHLIAISQATKADLIRRYGVASEKISVVYHGLGSQFRPTADQSALAKLQERYHLHHDYFLYIGTIQPRKNLIRLIDAFAQCIHAVNVSDSHLNTPSLQLVIAGKPGWLTTAIERQASIAGVAERVRFIGYVSETDLPILLSGALAFVFPSLYEGFGLPVLEAMACGVPVLTSTTSSLPEVAGDAALLVDPNDTHAIATALGHLATDHRLRADLRDRGLAHATQFTWERCAKQTLDVLLSIANRM